MDGRGSEENTDKSAVSSCEERKELASEEEASTTGGTGEAGRTLMETARALEGSDAKDKP